MVEGNLNKKSENGSPIPLSNWTINSHVTAMMDLWGYQCELGINSHGKPRGRVVKALLRDLSLRETQRKRDQYVDRGANTLNDGIIDDNLQSVAQYYLNQNRLSDVRNRADFLLMYGILARSQNTRLMQFPDLFMLRLDERSPTPCDALVMTMDRGKTNQRGQIEYGAVMRHKNVNVCPIGATALYLFSRFHMEGEQFPDFTKRENW
jgi:hypothetical protein